MTLGSDGQFVPKGILDLHWPSSEVDPAMGRGTRAPATNLEARFAVAANPAIYALEGTDILTASTSASIDYTSAKGRKDVVGRRDVETFVLVPEVQELSAPQYPLPVVISAPIVFTPGNTIETKIAPTVKLPKNLDAIDTWLPTLLENSRDGAELINTFVARSVELFIAGHPSPEVAFQNLYGEEGQLLQREIRAALERIREGNNESFATRERNLVTGALNHGPEFAFGKAIETAKRTHEAQQLPGYQSPLEAEMEAQYVRLARQIAERKANQRVVTGESAASAVAVNTTWRPGFRTSAIALTALVAFAATNPTVQRFVSSMGFNVNRGGAIVQQDRAVTPLRARPLTPRGSALSVEDRLIAELTPFYEAEERARLALEASPDHRIGSEYMGVETTSSVAERVRDLRRGGEIVIDNDRYTMDSDGFLRGVSAESRAD